MFRRKRCDDTGKDVSVGEDEEKDVNMKMFEWKGSKLARRTNINRHADMIQITHAVHNIRTRDRNHLTSSPLQTFPSKPHHHHQGQGTQSTLTGEAVHVNHSYLYTLHSCLAPLHAMRPWHPAALLSRKALTIGLISSLPGFITSPVWLHYCRRWRTMLGINVTVAFQTAPSMADP